VLIRDVLARGVGANLIHGHPASPLENISLENVRLTMASAAASPLQKSPNALTIENARNLHLKDFAITWEAPAAPAFRSALVVEDVHGLDLDGFSAQPPPNGAQAPAVIFKRVEGLLVRNSRF
jgi:hypothetical protein